MLARSRPALERHLTQSNGGELALCCLAAVHDDMDWHRPPLDGAIARLLEARDLRFESPYNTYRHIGLPPGPIANPGTMSLRAALDPATTEMIYFVADAEGGHVFSRTLAEHNRNVANYRQILAQQRREARIAEATATAPSPERSP